MRISFTIDVGIDVLSYVQAGEVLDRITHEVKEIVGSRGGQFDVRQFQADHTDIHKHSGIDMGYAERAQTPMEGPRGGF